MHRAALTTLITGALEATAHSAHIGQVMVGWALIYFLIGVLTWSLKKSGT